MSEENSDKTPIDLEVDTRGLVCPEPLIEVKEKSENLQIGQCFKVMADDPGSEDDFKNWAKETNTEIIEFSRGDDDLVFYFRKKK